MLRVPWLPCSRVKRPLPLPSPLSHAEPAAGPAERTAVFYAPWAIGCIWNQDLTTNHEPVFQIGINVFRYATGKRPLRRPLDGTSKPVHSTAEPEPQEKPVEEPSLK